MGTARFSRMELAALALSLAAGALLSVEAFLGTRGKSLCATAACEIVGHYVRFGEPLLVAGGAVFFLLLAAALFFSCRYPRFTSWLPALLLVGAFSFDGALLGFQFFTLQERCLICIGVAATLALTAILYFPGVRQPRSLFLCLVAWTSGFLANGVVVMPDVPAVREPMAFFIKKASTAHPKAPVATLVFSMHCPHCMEVLRHIGDHQDRKRFEWRLAFVDSDPDSHDKISFFLREKAGSADPFKELADLKEQFITRQANAMKSLEGSAKRARAFLAATGINTVPVLVVHEPDGRLVMLSGSARIKAYVDENKADPGE